MTLQLTTLSDTLNHTMMEGFLDANDRSKLAMTCKAFNKPDDNAFLTTSISVPKLMTIGEFGTQLAKYPRISNIDLSKARVITPEIIGRDHPALTITEAPIYSCSEKVANLLENKQLIIKNSTGTAAEATVVGIAAVAAGIGSGVAVAIAAAGLEATATVDGIAGVAGAAAGGVAAVRVAGAALAVKGKVEGITQRAINSLVLYLRS